MLPRAVRVLPIVGIAVACFVAPAAAQDSTAVDSTAAHAGLQFARVAPRPLTFAEKTAFYSNRTFSVRAVLGASYAAGIAQWRGTPREWGAGLSGYGRRDAAAYGAGVIRNTTEFGFGALLHEDPRFEPSTHNGFAARTADALHNTVFARTDDGGHRLAWSRVAASVVTGFSVNSWEPRRLHSTHHAVMLSLAGLASYATGNVMREFTPDIKRFVFRKLGMEDRK
jgi:hypothetical protein